MSAAPRRVLVTGGAGFIGTHSVDALLAGGATIMVVDDLRHRSHRPLAGAAELAVHDVAEEAARDAVTAFRPDAVLHLAAQGGVNRSWRQPADDARCNVLGTVSMLQAAVDAGCTRFVMASSGGALYGDAVRLPSAEGDPTAPRSPYGTAKLACEAYLRLFAAMRGLSVCALRYGNVYGPGQDGTGEAGLVAISCHRLLAGEAPAVRGDGEQTRDFVYVADVAAANRLAIDGTAAGAFNIGTGVETPVRAVAERLCEADGAGRTPEPAPAVAQEVRRSCLDPSLAGRELGWRATTSLSDGLTATYQSFREAAPR